MPVAPKITVHLLRLKRLEPLRRTLEPDPPPARLRIGKNWVPGANRRRQSMSTSPENHGILPDQWFAAADVALRKPKRAKSPVGNH